MTSKLSPKQQEFLLHSTAKINIAHGAVRSGKTHCTLIRFCKEAILCPDSSIYMIGASLSSIIDNGVKPIVDELYYGYTSWQPGRHVLTIGDKEIQVIGANDESAVRRIQGNTMSIVYVDEMSIIPTNFMNMLYTRLSKPHSILFGTTNPDSPYHPVKEVIDRADGKEIYALHFSINDNPYLPTTYRAMIENMFKGLYYKRFVLGMWIMAEGAVYDCFEPKEHVVRRPPTAAHYYIAGIDVGTSNPFAMVLIGVNQDVHPWFWVEKEFYWDPMVMGSQKTYAEFADDLTQMLEMYPVKAMYIDPAAASFILEMKRRRMPVKEADNDVINGIQTVSKFLSERNLVIHEDCKNTIREIQGYMWDPKKIKLGEDAPLKQNDHSVDALRYAIHSHFGKRANLQRKSHEQIMYEEELRRRQRMSPWGR